MLLPSLTAIRAARSTLQRAQEEFKPGVVIIAGVSFACAVHVGEFEPKMADDGINYRNGQDVRLSISKSALPAAPEPRTEITVNAVVYRVVNSGAQNIFDTAWHITARRFA